MDPFPARRWMTRHIRAMGRVMRILLLAAGLGLPGGVSMAQQALPTPAPVPLPPPVALPPGEQTPPILPKLVETPQPPPLELPTLPPDCMLDIPDRPLTADETVLIALHYQASLLAAKGKILVAQGQQQQVKSALGPQLTVNTRLSQSLLGATAVNNGGNISTGTGNLNTGVGTTGNFVGFSGTTLTTSLQQLLFDFSHTRELVRQAAALTQSAQANLTRTQSDLILQVKQGFYQYVQNLRLVTVNEENVRNSQQHFALTRARVQAGVGLPSDMVTAQTAVANATLNLTLARNTAVTSRVLLAQMMGIDPRTPIQPAESTEAEIDASDMNNLVAQALQRRPEILQAQAAVTAACHEIKAAKTTNYPSVSGIAGTSFVGSTLPTSSRSFDVGLLVQWVPIDSGLTKGLVTQAHGDLLTAQAQLCTAQQQVVADVAQVYLNLITAKQRVTTTIAEVANAEESLHLVVGRYEAGVGIFLDVLDAQTALTTANTNRVNAQSALEQARAALAHAVYCNTIEPASRIEGRG